jgi:CTP:molybdopterin cytidylyltransferase MocA
MNLSHLVAVADFPVEAMARVAASALEAAGIPVIVTSDDLGGTLPGLHPSRGVRLLVNKNDEERAREILGEVGEEP